MSTLRIRKPIFVFLALLLALTVLGITKGPPAPSSGTSLSGGNNVFALKAPSFLSVAHAEESSPTAFPVDEAGISAYFQSATPINLADVRSVFRVIEMETSDYIIGSVDVANYQEAYDVHTFVHRNGWFVAYYLSSDPVAKIADIRSYGGSRIDTLLEQTLNIVAVSAGVPVSGITYYDFRYPNATHLMFIGETNGDGNSFTIQLPSNFVYYARSWTVIDRGNGAWFNVDGNNVNSICCGNPYYGTLTPVQLLPDIVHTIAVHYDGLLVLIYRVP